MFSRRTAWSLTPNALARALDAHPKRELLDLTASNPTRVGLHYEEAEILGALADSAALVYRPEPKGLFPARAAVTEYYREISSGSVQISPERIILTVSTSEAYSFVFRLLCEVGDEVLVPVPSYPLFEFLAGLQDIRLTPYSLFYDHGWHIDLASLESALTPRSRAIIVVHPNNPTGSYVKSGERETLNRLCAAHELALIADEVFLDYPVREDAGVRGPGLENSSFGCNQNALTFTLSGLSKIAGLPQMKLAWIVASGPEELVGSALSRLEVIADTYLSMNAPIQHAAPMLLAQRHTVVSQLRARVRINLAELDRQLARQSLCCRLAVEGGWYVILRVPATQPDEELAIALLQRRNVLVQPGYFYDFRNEGYLVLSLITPEQEFAEGVRRLLEFVIGDL
jgi:aspartate/methionine/tyrosine aminotransferase